MDAGTQFFGTIFDTIFLFLGAMVIHENQGVMEEDCWVDNRSFASKKYGIYSSIT